MDLEHEKRLTATEERAKSNTKRLDKLEPIVEAIHAMGETLVEMNSEMKHTNKNMEEIKEKVEAIESEPAKRWKNTVDKLWGAIFGAIGTALAGGILYLLTIVR